MSSKEYNQLLKFLYFEEYADSYEEAEYILESMSDDEFDELCEEMTPENRKTWDKLVRERGPRPWTDPQPQGRKKSARKSETPDSTSQPQQSKKRTTKLSDVQFRENFDVVTEYLFVEGYANSIENAEVMAENISEEWVNEILNEMEVQPPREPLKTERNMFTISQEEKDEARKRILAKAKEMRRKKGIE